MTHRRADARTSRTRGCTPSRRTGRLSGIARFFSGRRLNVTLTSDPARTGIANQRPNLVLDNPYGDKSYDYSESRGVRRAGARHARQPAAQRHRRPGHQGGGPVAVAPVPVRNHRIEARAEAFNAFNWFNPASTHSLSRRPSNNSPVVNLQQRPVREDYRGRRPADHAVRDQVAAPDKVRNPASDSRILLRYKSARTSGHQQADHAVTLVQHEDLPVRALRRSAGPRASPAVFPCAAFFSWMICSSVFGSPLSLNRMRRMAVLPAASAACRR